MSQQHFLKNPVTMIYISSIIISPFPISFSPFHIHSQILSNKNNNNNNSKKNKLTKTHPKDYNFKKNLTLERWLTRTRSWMSSISRMEYIIQNSFTNQKKTISRFIPKIHKNTNNESTKEGKKWLLPRKSSEASEHWESIQGLKTPPQWWITPSLLPLSLPFFFFLLCLLVFAIFILFCSTSLNYALNSPPKRHYQSKSKLTERIDFKDRLVFSSNQSTAHSPLSLSSHTHSLSLLTVSHICIPVYLSQLQKTETPQTKTTPPLKV